MQINLKPLIMKALKVIGIIAAVLFGMYVVAAFFAPKSLLVEKSIVIEAPASAIYPNVACFRNWEPWNPWDAMDSTNTNEFSEQECGVGSWYTWSGQATGTGRQDLLEARENEYIKTKLVFSQAPEPQTSEWFFEETEEGTKVTWNFIGTESSLLSRPGNWAGEMFLGAQYEGGLATLKEYVESNPMAETPSFDIETIDLPETSYLLVSDDVKPEDIGMYYAENFGLIMEYMGEKGVEMNGHPSGFYYVWTDTLAKMSAAIPVASEIEGTDEIEFRTIEACQALRIAHYGAYDAVGPAHYAMEAYAAENGLTIDMAIEEYVTDPEAEPDTSKWLTNIIYPITAE